MKVVAYTAFTYEAITKSWQSKKFSSHKGSAHLAYRIAFTLYIKQVPSDTPTTVHRPMRRKLKWWMSNKTKIVLTNKGTKHYVPNMNGDD